MSNQNHALLMPRRRGLFAVRNDAVNIESLHRAFNEFRAANDARIAELESRGSADTLLTEKMATINAAMTAMETEMRTQAERMAGLSMGGGGLSEDDGGLAPAARREHRVAFNDYFRTGSPTAMREFIARNQLNGLSNPDGGFLVPAEYETVIDRVLQRISAMRGLARVLPVGSRTYTKFVNQGGAGGNWVGEKQDAVDTDTPELSELTFNVRTLRAYPKTTQDLLDDGIIDIAAWLAGEIDITFADLEGDSFLNGTGKLQPRGLLTYDMIANANYAWGKIGFLTSAAAGTFTADDIVAMTYALRRGYRSNASWLMNDTTIGLVRSLKDGQGRYIWQPTLTMGEPSTLNGYPVETDDHVPDVAANALALAFADFKRAYLIVDRQGIIVVRDNVTEPGYVKFNTYKRVGGGVQNFEAVKVLKIRA